MSTQPEWRQHPDHVEPPEPDNAPLESGSENASEA